MHEAPLSVSTDPAPAQDERQAIEVALTDRSGRPLAPALAGRYEARHGKHRRIRLVRVQFVNAITSLLGIAIEAYDNPAILRTAILGSFAVSCLFLASAFALKRTKRPGLETPLFIVPHAALMVMIEVFGQSMPPHLADRYMIVAGCCIAATISVATMRMRTAVALAALTAACFPLPILLLPGPIAFPHDLDLFLIACGGLGIALLVSRRNDIERQRQFLLTLRLEQNTADMGAMNLELARLSNTDALTGLANRRQLDAELNALWHAAPPPAIGAVLIDIDHFKKFNDSAGHAAGDQCLRQVAAAIGSTVRRGDLAARYGGEEFAIILPGVANSDLVEAAERVRLAVANLELPHPALDGGFVSISLGVARTEGARPPAPDALLRAADEALYEAKRAGRNRVAVHTGAVPPAAPQEPSLAVTANG